MELSYFVHRKLALIVNQERERALCFKEGTLHRRLYSRGQSEVKRSRRNFEAGQAVKVGIGGSLDTVKGSPGDRLVNAG